jgi:hypothetical protein
MVRLKVTKKISFFLFFLLTTQIEASNQLDASEIQQKSHNSLVLQPNQEEFQRLNQQLVNVILDTQQNCWKDICLKVTYKPADYLKLKFYPDIIYPTDEEIEKGFRQAMSYIRSIFQKRHISSDVTTEVLKMFLNDQGDALVNHLPIDQESPLPKKIEDTIQYKSLLIIKKLCESLEENSFNEMLFSDITAIFQALHKKGRQNFLKEFTPISRRDISFEKLFQSKESVIKISPPPPPPPFIESNKTSKKKITLSSPKESRKNNESSEKSIPSMDRFKKSMSMVLPQDIFAQLEGAQKRLRKVTDLDRKKPESPKSSIQQVIENVMLKRRQSINGYGNVNGSDDEEEKDNKNNQEEKFE